MRSNGGRHHIGTVKKGCLSFMLKENRVPGKGNNTLKGPVVGGSRVYMH